MKSVSVVMPFFNGNDYLFEALESISNNNVSEVIIVVDQGSEDPILENVSIDVRLIYNDDSNGRGAGVCRALGFEASITKYVAFLDCDDIWDENKITEQDLLIPMIDARRMEVYTAVFDIKLNKIKETEALILENHSFDEFLSKSSCHFIGDGAEKSELLFKRKTTNFTPAIYPSAKVMAQYVEKRFIAQKFEDTAYFEPYYLKDFVDGQKSKN